jgi:hypothetical protein
VVFAEGEDVVQTLPSYGFQETLDLSCRKTHLPPIDINSSCALPKGRGWRIPRSPCVLCQL